jgi:MFS family permease
MHNPAQALIRQSRKKWHILAACSGILCINAAFPIYGASVVNTAMITSMGQDRSLLGLFVTANMVVTGLTAPLVGSIVGRLGARFTLIGGSLLMILGSLVMATLVHAPLPAILTFGILVGLAMSSGGFVANQACVAGWFREDRARPFGILYATMGVGGFLAAPLINNVIGQTHDWRAGWLVFTALGVVSLFLALFVVRDAHVGVRDTHGAVDVAEFAPSAQATENGGGKRSALLILLMCIMAAGASSALYIAHGLAMLQDFGHPATAATTSMSLMAASTLAGNMAIGILGARFGVRRILAAGSFTFAIGLVLLANARSPAFLYIYPLFLGAGFGAVQVGAMALLSKCVPSNRFAKISGIAFSLETVSSATTPFLGGFLFDTTHTYMPLTLTLAAMNGLAALLLLLNKQSFPARA